MTTPLQAEYESTQTLTAPGSLSDLQQQFEAEQGAAPVPTPPSQLTPGAAVEAAGKGLLKGAKESVTGIPQFIGDAATAAVQVGLALSPATMSHGSLYIPISDRLDMLKQAAQFPLGIAHSMFVAPLQNVYDVWKGIHDGTLTDEQALEHLGQAGESVGSMLALKYGSEAIKRTFGASNTATRDAITKTEFAKQAAAGPDTPEIQQIAAQVEAARAQTLADRAATRAASNAWNFSATPEMRKALVPGVADEHLGKKWSELPDDVKTAARQNIQAQAVDANSSLNQPDQTTVSPPTPAAAPAPEVPPAPVEAPPAAPVVSPPEPPRAEPAAVAPPAPLPSPSELVDRLPPEMQTSKGTLPVEDRLSYRTGGHPSDDLSTVDVFKKINQLSLDDLVRREGELRTGQNPDETPHIHAEIAARSVLDQYLQLTSHTAPETARELIAKGQDRLLSDKDVEFAERPSALTPVQSQYAKETLPPLPEGDPFQTNRGPGYISTVKAIAWAKQALGAQEFKGLVQSKIQPGDTDAAKALVLENEARKAMQMASSARPSELSPAAMPAQEPAAGQRTVSAEGPPATEGGAGAGQGAVAEGGGERVGSVGLNTLADIDAAKDALENRYDAGEINDVEYGKQILALGKRTRELKAQPVAPTREGQTDQTYSQFTDEKLRQMQQDFKSRALAASTPAEQSLIAQDLEAVRREIRYRRPVDQFPDDKLVQHQSEVRERLRAATSDDKPAIADRMAAINTEIIKRKENPNPVDILGNEKGFLRLTSEDPYEAKIDKSRPEYEQNILRRINREPKQEPLIDNVDGHWSVFDAAYQSFVRSIHAAEKIASLGQQLTGQALPILKDPGKLAELFTGTASRAEAGLRFGPFRWQSDGNIQFTGTPGYAEILKPFKGRLNEVRAYNIAMAAIESYKSGRPIGVNVLDAVKTVANAAPDVKAAFEQEVQFRRDALQYLVDSGVYSKEAYAFLEATFKNYVPLYRVLDDRFDVHSLVGPKAGATEPLAGAGKQVYKRLISTALIEDPIASTVDQYRRFVRAADLNRVGTSLTSLAEQFPEEMSPWIRKSAGAPVADVKISKIAENLKATAKSMGTVLGDEAAQSIAQTLADRGQQPLGGRLRVWQDGKAVTWQIHPALEQMYKAMSPSQLHWSLMLASLPSRVAKTLIVDNPGFALFNIIRDGFDATLQSENGFLLGRDSARGFMQSITDADIRKQFLAAGAGQTGIVGHTFSTKAGATRAILPESGTQVTMNLVRHPVEALRQFSQPFEESSRLGEFARAKMLGKSDLEAALAGMRVTTNFRIFGASPAMRALNQIAMFTNPAIQSLDVMRKAAIRDPAGLMLRGVGLISIPAALLWYANRNDKEIGELRKAPGGENYFYIRKNDDTILRLPKPFLWGQIFGTGMEHTLDKLMDHDPNAALGWIESIGRQAGFNILPNVTNLGYGLWANKDMNTGAPIVPEELASGPSQVESRFQSRPETGTSARFLGDWLNLSPAKIEYTVRNQLGTIGLDAMRAMDYVADAGRKQAPSSVKSDIPAVGRFFARYPTGGAASVRQFYDDAVDAEKVTNTARLLEHKDPTRLLSYIKDNQQALALAPIYAEGRQDLTDLRNAAEAIRDLPPSAMAPERRRELIDQYTRIMIMRAAAVNKAVQNIGRK